MKRAPVVAKYESDQYGQTVWSYFKKNTRYSIARRVNCIAINNNAPFKYAIPCGRAINIYKISTDLKCRRVSGFSQTITSCNFRHDGKMIIGGEVGGLLRICTTDKNTYQLRKIQAHEGDIIDANFFSDGLKAISLGADGMAKSWDISVGELQSKFRVSHAGEPPSGLAVGKTHSDLFSTGNFDGCVSIYDVRQESPICKFTLPTSVSALHFASDDNLLVAAAGQWIYAWDIASGKAYNPTGQHDSNKIPGFYTHYKLVTDITSCYCPDVYNGEILLSVGMDKLLKVTSLNTFEELHQERLSAPLTAVGVLPNLKSVIVGTETGIVRSFKFALPAPKLSDKKPTTPVSGGLDDFGGIDASLAELASHVSGNWRAFGGEGLQGKHLKTDAWFAQENQGGTQIGPKDWGFEGARAPLIHENTEISRYARASEEIKQLTRLDKILARFQHTRALSESLVIGQKLNKQRKRRKAGQSSPVVTAAYAYPVAVIHELSRRNALAAAVSGRSPLQLTRLLRFVRRNVWVKPATPSCIFLFRMISELYPVETLSTIPDYAKVCKLIRIMSENSNSLCILSQSVRNLFADQQNADAVQLKAQKEETEDVKIKLEIPSKSKKRPLENNTPSAKKSRKLAIKTEY